MAQIIPGIKSCVGIRTIEGIDIESIVKAMRLCKLDKAIGQLIVIRAMGILNAYGYLMLLAFEVQTYAAHINADYLAGVLGDSA